MEHGYNRQFVLLILHCSTLPQVTTYSSEIWTQIVTLWLTLQVIKKKKPGLGKADKRGLEFHPDLTPVQGLKYLGHFPFLPHTYEQALDLK